MTFREDIHRLRGVSVLLVVLFHFGLPGFNGGYLGVDIFFVISGYLITKLLTKEYAQTGQINLASFYGRRIKRIFPSAFVVLWIFTVLGIILLPSRSEQFANEAAWSFGQISNFFYWTQSNYFSPVAEELLFLNFWSLAIEEQFYLFWPIILGLALSINPRNKFIWLAIFIGLLIPTYWLWLSDANSAFYLLIGRWWELGAGASLALWGGVKSIRHTKLLGWGLIVIALLIPEFFADIENLLCIFFATLGTCLVLMGQTTQSKAIPIWNKGLMFFGDISYTLYLCHWPILVIWHQRMPHSLDMFDYGVVFLISVLVAYLLHKCVEGPIRHATFKNKTLIFSFLIASVCSLLICASYSKLTLNSKSDGRRFQDYAQTRSTLPKGCHGSEKLSYPGINQCRFGNLTNDKLDLLLVGDSHAEHWEPGMAKFSRDFELSGALFSYSSGLPIVGIYQYKDKEFLEDIQLWRESLLATIDRSQPSTIILAARWSIYFETEQFLEPKRARFYAKTNPSQLESENVSQIAIETALAETVTAIQQRGHKVIILGQVPEYSRSQTDCVQRSVDKKMTTDKCGPLHSQVLERLRPATQMLKRVSKATDAALILPHQSLCDFNSCDFIVDGVYIYRDDDHLNAKGSEKMIEKIMKPHVFEISD